MATIYNIKPDCFKEDGYLSITSPFGKRTDPVTGKENVTHAGVDCVRKTTNGSATASITAVADGEVITAHWGEKDNKNYSSARGNYVKIKHNDNIITLY